MKIAEAYQLCVYRLWLDLRAKYRGRGNGNFDGDEDCQFCAKAMQAISDERGWPGGGMGDIPRTINLSEESMSRPPGRVEVRAGVAEQSSSSIWMSEMRGYDIP